MRMSNAAGSVPKLATLGLLIVVALTWARPSGAASVTFHWDPPSGWAPSGYILFAGTAPGMYSIQIDVGATTTHTLDGLQEGGTYYVAVAAYDAAGVVSPKSNEVSATIPSAPPAALRGTVRGNSWGPARENHVTVQADPELACPAARLVTFILLDDMYNRGDRPWEVWRRCHAAD